VADSKHGRRVDDPDWLRAQYASRSIADLAAELGCAPRRCNAVLDAYRNVCANRPDPPPAEPEEESTRNEPNPIM
jgi:hypothetical protein